ncbi:MAG: EF-hand domain-containing protein [Propionivibrio sp.]
MSSVSSISTSSIASLYSETTSARRQRPDASTMAEDLFSKLDTTGKGYIEQSDLTSALSGLASGTSAGSTTSASDLFSQLDSDGDGKVTQDELTTSLQKLADSLDSQFDQMRMQGAMPPPPPPSEDDAGFTKDELSEQLSEIGSSDSARSGLISNVVNNFDAADTNGDGKVSFQEAMAYDQANPTTSSSSTTDSASATDSTSATTSVAGSEQTDAQVFRQLMALLRAYGESDDSTSNLLSTLVTSA